MNLKVSDLYKNLLTLITGTALAQLIPISLQPILRRIFTPEDFGEMAVYLSVVGMLASIACLRYDQAIVLPKKDEDANSLMVLSMIISLVFGMAVFLFMIAFEQHILSFLDLGPESALVIYIAPISLTLIGSYHAVNFKLIRHKEFKKSSANKVFRRSFEGAFQLGCSKFYNFSGLLIVGDIIGNMANLFIGLFQLRKLSLGLRSINLESIKKVAKDQIEFPKFNTIPTLLNSIGLFIPVIIINKFFSEGDTGQLDLSRQVLAIPLSLISMSLAQVITQKAAESKNENRSIKKEVNQIIIGLVGAVIVGVIVMELFSVEIFSFVFGPQWSMAGEITQVLLFSYAIKFVVSPLSSLLTVFKKLKLMAVWQFVYFFLIVLLWFCDGIDIFAFLKIYVGLEILAYSIYFILIYRELIKYESSVKASYVGDN